LVYTKQTWSDLPTQTTPLSAARLNKLETQYDEAVATAQIFTYRWANAAARTAQTGMRVGDIGFQVDTNTEYKFIVGSTWRVWNTPWISYSPVIVGMTNTTAVARYRISGDQLLYRGNVTCNATPSFSSLVEFPTPVPISTVDVSFNAVRATVNMISTGVDEAEGYFLFGGSAGLYLFYRRVSGSASVRGYPNATNPFTWKATDVIHFDTSLPLL